MIRARSVGRRSTGNEALKETGAFAGLVLDIVTGSMSGTVILRFVASTTRFWSLGLLGAERSGVSLIR